MHRHMSMIGGGDQVHAKGDVLSLPPIEHAAQLPIDKSDRCHRLWRASPTIVRGNIGLPGAYRQHLRRVQVGEAVYLDFSGIVGRPNN